ncbi:MAG: hypothetical protein AAB417_01960 [Patescibacteria group bacterium]
MVQRGRGNKGAGNANNAGNRQPRLQISKVDYTTPEKLKDGTFTILLLADIVGGNGSEQIRFYLDRSPQGTSASVEQYGRTGYAQTRTDSGLRIGTRYEVAAEIIAGGKVVGNRVARFIVLPKETKKSLAAKKAQKVRDEIELKRLERELRELAREPSVTAREIKDLQEQVAVIKARRERDELFRGPTLLERAAKNVTAQIMLTKLRKELSNLGKIPAKEIVRPVIECVGSNGHYIVSGCVVYKDSSFATRYPVLISAAPYRGIPTVEPVLTDEHGYFTHTVQFGERSADIHVIVGGTGGYEEFYNDYAGPKPRGLRNNNVRLATIWLIAALLLVFNLWLLPDAPLPSKVEGLPEGLREGLLSMHPEWAPTAWQSFLWFFNRGMWGSFWILVVAGLVYLPVAFSDEAAGLGRAVVNIASKKQSGGGGKSPPASGSPQAGTTPTSDADPLAFLKGKGPFITAIGAVIFTIVTEWLERRRDRKIHSLANKIVGGKPTGGSA